MDLDRYLSFAKHVLTPPRFEHSLGVMQIMGELATVYALDQTTALTIGLLHDAAKEVDLDRQIELAKEANITLHEKCDINPFYLHGPVSAYVIAKELDVTDLQLDTYLNNRRDSIILMLIVLVFIIISLLFLFL